MSTCQVRGQLTGAGSLLSLCRFPGLTQVIRLGSNCLYLPSPLTSPTLGFLMPRDLWISPEPSQWGGWGRPGVCQ